MINQTRAEIVVNEITNQLDKIGFFPFFIGVAVITIIVFLSYSLFFMKEKEK